MSESKKSLPRLSKLITRKWFIVEFFILLIVTIVFFNNVLTGLTLFEFGDETEKFVAAKMMNEGLILYKDIFAHHGPLNYLFVHLYTKFISNTDFTYVRLINFFLALIAAVSIFFSPILKKIDEKIWTLIFFFTILSSLWLVQVLHFVLYHAIAGLLFVLPLMQLALPALLNQKITKMGAFFSGVFIVLICFASYALGVAVFLLLTATFLAAIKSSLLTKNLIFSFASGVISSLIIVLGWLLIFGDPLGYFGYHIYFNQEIYSDFVPFNPLMIFDNFRVSINRKTLVHLLSISQFILWIGVFIFLLLRQKQSTRYLKFVSLFILALSILFLNPFGTKGFKNAGLLIGNLTMFSSAVVLFISKTFDKKAPFLIVASFIVLTIVMKLVSDNSVSAVHYLPKSSFDKFHVSIKPSSEDEFNFIREVTEEDEKILSLVFNPIIYIKSNRLPASAHFYYLPWQAAYEDEPFLNYKINICEDILRNKPKIIWFDNWKVWDLYSIETYEPCITNIIAEFYTKLEHQNLFIRNDNQDTQINNELQNLIDH